MAWPFLDGMIKVVVTYGFDGVPSINVHFVLQRTPESPIPDAELRSAANAFHVGYAQEWKHMMGEDWSIDNITGLDFSQEDGAQIQTNLTLPIDGSEITPEIPASVALVVSHRTDRTGRSRRGRTYLAGLTEGSTDGNTVDATAITRAGDCFDDIDTNLDSIDMDHVVYSLYSEGVARAVPIATLITNRIINNRVDTQRRRLPA